MEYCKYVPLIPKFSFQNAEPRNPVAADNIQKAPQNSNRFEVKTQEVTLKVLLHAIAKKKLDVPFSYWNRKDILIQSKIQNSVWPSCTPHMCQWPVLTATFHSYSGVSPTQIICILTYILKRPRAGASLSCTVPM